MVLSKDCVFVFDLDDTLFSEREFETSGIRRVYDFLNCDGVSLDQLLNNRKRWVNLVLQLPEVKCSKEEVLELYRHHTPNIRLYDDASVFLKTLYSLGADMAIVTDGRSRTQRNKLLALGIHQYFQRIIISEEINSTKPNKKNFLIVENDFPNREYVYFGDNYRKDFKAPNELGWHTVARLDAGNNVHAQNQEVSIDFLPQTTIGSFYDIKVY